MKKYNWDWENSNSPIPDISHEALINYFVRRLEPGSFMTAMLEGDLYRAVSSADHWNRSRIADIAKWILWNAPRGSFGSKEAVRGWLDGNAYFQAFEKDYMFDILQDKQE